MDVHIRKHFKSAHPGHDDVQKDNGYVLAVMLEKLYTFLAASRFDYRKFVAENRNEYLAVEFRIVDYEHVRLLP